jgi:hypothetical protein
MDRPKERYLTDAAGKRTAVVLDIADYERLLEELEELDDVRAYDEAKAAHEEPVPLEPVVERIRRRRK